MIDITVASPLDVHAVVAVVVVLVVKFHIVKDRFPPMINSSIFLILGDFFLVGIGVLYWIFQVQLSHLMNKVVKKGSNSTEEMSAF